jgi:hypothetical protein
MTCQPKKEIKIGLEAKEASGEAMPALQTLRSSLQRGIRHGDGANEGRVGRRRKVNEVRGEGEDWMNG